MHTYLISYDLHWPETSQDYKNLISEIINYGIWAKPLESCWFVKSYDSIDSIINNLWKYIDANDRLVVLNVTNDLWGSLNIPKEVSNWMNSNI